MDKTIELKIQDNGQGFDPSDVLSPDGSGKGLGLISMRERAKLSGGDCKIESGLEKGTTVCASWSIDSQEPASSRE